MVTLATTAANSSSGPKKIDSAAAAGSPVVEADEDNLVALLKQAAQPSALLDVALKPSAILFELLRTQNSKKAIGGRAVTAPTFPSSPAKKGFVEKMFGRRKSVTLNQSDPTFKTLYLGNVVTALPKGDGCLKKPLEAIWKHYKTTRQPPSEMVVTVTNGGLKARTAEQGAIEYKASRLTHCAAPADYPKVFAWIYKHDGTSAKQSLKYEARCHAVLCADELKARDLSTALESRLQFVFAEWLRHKRSRSSILDRLRNPELAAALPAIPARKQMLSAGQKYKTPAGESKSRSLSAICEAADERYEDDDDEDEDDLAGVDEDDEDIDDDDDDTVPPTPPAMYEELLISSDIEKQLPADFSESPSHLVATTR